MSLLVSSQYIPSSPPEREQEESGQHQGRNLARVGIETARDQASANEGRAKVASWKRDPTDATGHTGRTSLVRYKKLASASKTTKFDGVAYDRVRLNGCARR